MCLYGSKAFNIASTSSSDNHFSTILNDFWQYNNPTNRITDSPSQRTPASLNHYSTKNTTHQWSSLLEKNADINQFINPETHALESDSTDKFDNVIPYHRRHAKRNSLPTGVSSNRTEIPSKQPSVHTTTVGDPWETINTLSPYPNLSRTAKSSPNANSRPTTARSAQFISGGNFYYDGTTYSTNDAFNLSSNPNAEKTIYLDFDGADLTSTAWSVSSLPAYSLDNDFNRFSTTEREAIIEIWQRVSADFAPWDVNVTTAEPSNDSLSRSSYSDDIYGTTALITSDTPSWFYSGAGGVAYLYAFDDTSNYYKPALTFADRLSNNTKYIAEATSHEIGHNLGLSHDGTEGGSAYYSGTSGINWAPIMGVGYYKDRVTFGRSSDYSNGNEDENDFQIFANSGLTWWDASSESDNSTAEATPLTFNLTTTYNNDTAAYTSSIDLTDAGGDGTPDIDYYQFSANTNSEYSFTVSNALLSSIGIDNNVDILSDWEGNLLSLIKLYDSELNLLETSQTSTSSNSFTYTTTSAGTHYISIEADPSPIDNSPSWGNLGGY
ncbi:zinc-dependent metalloprotease, partial [Synechococcus sp. AH-736-G21]|nr:zinc-dependent metalloprotease [Synechococcus sp. AH-736-G21]